MKKIVALIAGVVIGTLSAAAAVADPGGPVYQSWQLLGRLASAISVIDTSAATALPAGGLSARICNLGSVEAYVTLGTGNTVVTTATAGSWVKQGTCMAYALRPVPGLTYSYIAAITASSTTTLYVEVGNGNW
jgi:hypothetical protein